MRTRTLFALTLLPALAVAEDGATGSGPADVESITVTATRSESAVADVPANITILGEADVDRSPFRRLDDFLKQVPGFSLLRQSSSIVASNSIQGVSLRGMGPTNTGRTLVLLDGVPLNDPVAGHVNWSRIPLGRIQRTEVVRGGGSGIWGNLAMGGVIHVLTRQPLTPELDVNVQTGSLGTTQVEAFGSVPSGKLTFSGGGNYYRTDGYDIWREDLRGPIDEPVRLENGTVMGRVDYSPSTRSRVHLEGSYAEEDRHKGTPLGHQGFTTHSIGGGGTLETSGGTAWTFNAFTLVRDAFNVSTSLSSDRDSETPRSRNYEVPSIVVGANLGWSRSLGGAHRLSVGVDGQHVDGESAQEEGWDRTDERFTRDKRVGGKRRFLGAYVQDVITPSPKLRLVTALRLDAVRAYAGRDVVTDLETGETTSDTSFEEDTKTTLNPSVGIVFHASDAVSLRGSGYTGFRTPTISEQYRGASGRGGTIISGNAELGPEELIGGELGVDLRPDPAATVRLTGFWNEVEGTITQRRIAFADEDEETTIEPCGVVPAGGVCLQTDNVGRLRSRGLELEGTLRPHESLRFVVSYMYMNTTLTESDDPELVDNRVRHVPEHGASVRGTFDRPSLFTTTIQARYVGDRFEDAENELLIDDFIIVDAFVSRRITEGYRVFVAVENVFDEAFQVRQTASGLVEIGAPRILQAGVRVRL